MKRQISSPCPHRVRRSSREIAFALAITLAAVIMFLMAREPTELASAPSAESETIGNP